MDRDGQNRVTTATLRVWLRGRTHSDHDDDELALSRRLRTHGALHNKREQLETSCSALFQKAGLSPMHPIGSSAHGLCTITDVSHQHVDDVAIEACRGGAIGPLQSRRLLFETLPEQL